jgi:hypothetical protein
MPFIPPNRYWPRPDWKQVLKMLGGGFGNWPAPVGSWQLDLVAYQQKRDGGMPLLKAWSQAGMSIDNAKKSLMQALPAANNLSGLIPPEIFSRVLARTRASDVDPDDDAADAIVENSPAGAAATFSLAGARSKTATRKAAKSAKRKVPKRKSAKSPKRKAAKPKAPKRKVAKRKAGRRRT